VSRERLPEARQDRQGGQDRQERTSAFNAESHPKQAVKIGFARPAMCEMSTRLGHLMHDEIMSRWVALREPFPSAARERRDTPRLGRGRPIPCRALVHLERAV